MGFGLWTSGGQGVIPYLRALERSKKTAFRTKLRSIAGTLFRIRCSTNRTFGSSDRQRQTCHHENPGLYFQCAGYHGEDQFHPDNKEFVSSGVTFILNPYDEIALSKAVDLAATGGTVTVINIGDGTTEPTIRKALAIGATDGVRINAAPRDSYFVAAQIADYVKRIPSI